MIKGMDEVPELHVENVRATFEEEDHLGEWACTICEEPAEAIHQSKTDEWTRFGLCAMCLGLIKDKDENGLAARRFHFYVEEGPEAARRVAEQMIRD